MRHILNTLFILTEDAYVALENENVVVLQEEKVLGRIPLLTLENILCFTYKGASPALMGACAQAKIGLCFPQNLRRTKKYQLNLKTIN